MAPVRIFKFPILSPADTSPLQELKRAGYDASQIIGVVGKTEGNGCVNDFSRTLAALAWEQKIPVNAVTIFSGGTEGVLSPHVTFFVSEEQSGPSGLSACVGRTRHLLPHEVGSAQHARQVALTVVQLMKEATVTPEQVHLVLVKCPLLTSAKLEVIRAEGRTPITTDTYESMSKSRYASAIGIAVALGEIAEGALEDALSLGEAWSAKASCSSGAELDDCHILLLASTTASEKPLTSTQGELRVISKPMTDAIDAASILDLLDQVKKDEGKVVQVFAKAEADPRGHIRGWRHTMNTDSDIHSTRHARAAVGGLIAGLVSDTQIYVSGGAEGQGAPGGGSLCSTGLAAAGPSNPCM